MGVWSSMWTERALRAELVADELAGALGDVLAPVAGYVAPGWLAEADQALAAHRDLEHWTSPPPGVGTYTSRWSERAGRAELVADDLALELADALRHFPGYIDAAAHDHALSALSSHGALVARRARPLPAGPGAEWAT